MRQPSPRPILQTFAIAAFLFAAGWTVAVAQGGGATAPVPAQGRGTPAPATEPMAPRNPTRHEAFLAIARAGNIDLLFVGDSITDWWARAGQAVWTQTFASLKPANFGIAGDTTQGVLWRMQNGELEGFKAKLIVLMLGTNNINRNPNDDIVEGNRLIVEEFKKRQPQAKVLVLGIFPRSAQPTSPFRGAIKEINDKLSKFADGRQVFYMDIGDKFLAADGTLPADVMPDGLHPNEKGYQIWADAIGARVKELMK
jgi:lysophospholipase L1-like esterase